MTIEELKQPYEPEGVYAGMTQAEALRYLAKRYLRKPECVALCNDVANNLPALLKVAEAAQTMLDAIDKGSVDSEEIVPVPGDGHPYRFHEEWAHHTRKALEEVVQLRDRVEKLEAEKQAAMDHAAAAVETAKRLEVENKALRQAGQAVIEDCANLFGQRDTRAEDWANKLLVDLQYLRALMEDK